MKAAHAPSLIFSPFHADQEGEESSISQSPLLNNLQTSADALLQ